jgi:peptidoglycan/LPS O-acetylase OafA/YrhL
VNMRVQYLEGLRGIAAVQVVLLHFVTAFLPQAAERAPAPLPVLFDGHTAVYVFFLISGAVLTGSFARGGPWPNQVAKRLIRLGIPVAAAATLALILLAAMPDAHIRASGMSGSAWLAMDSSGAATMLHLVREISLDSLLVGYREYTLFAPFAGHLPLLEHSLNAPFWSLHLELYGSLLILALVQLKGRSTGLHRTAIILCAATFGTHPMFLFVLGHLCAPQLNRAARPLPGAILVVLGLAMSATKDWPVLEVLRAAVAHVAPVAAPNLYQFQSQLAALALFLGTVMSPTAQRLFAAAPCCDLGRLSFGIYLVHFPILFTVACAGFLPLVATFPYSVAVTMAFVGFAAVVLITAALFERWIDRPAIRLSRSLTSAGAAVY